MNRSKKFFIIFHFLFSIFIIIPACEKTVEEEVIKPIEMMYGQKNVATALAAESNVRTVRAALLRYPTTSPTNHYPGDMDIYDYRTLRDVLPDENLPSDMAELMWDPAFGVTYRSDGYTFTFEVRALSADGEIITATPGGIMKSQ